MLLPFNIFETWSSDTRAYFTKSKYVTFLIFFFKLQALTAMSK